MAQGDSIFYKMKNVNLVPDEYGMKIEIKMLSAETGKGKFVKNLKLNDDALRIIKEGIIVFNDFEENK